MGKLAPSWQTLTHPIRNTALVSLGQLKESKQNVTHNYITGNWHHLDRSWYKSQEFHYFLTLHSSSDLKTVKQIFLLMYAAT